MASAKLKSPHVSVHSVRKSFGKNSVLTDVDLEIGEGEFVALVGKSGCGKSTLLRLIAGLAKPDGGDIRVRDLPLSGINRESRVMFQEARIIPWKTVAANVALGLKGAWRDRSIEMLSLVGLADRAGDWPAVLSGGQLQRVALARALATSPDLLLLDEPLGSLDALTRIEMQDLIHGLWLKRKFSALLITHEVEEALVLADRVVVLEQGGISLEVKVELPRPRDRGAPEFAALKSRILGRIMGKPESVRAQRQAGNTDGEGREPIPETRSLQYAI